MPTPTLTVQSELGETWIARSSCTSPATCAMHGQAYLAETAIGRSLGSRDRVKVVCMLPNEAEEAMVNLGNR